MFLQSYLRISSNTQLKFTNTGLVSNYKRKTLYDKLSKNMVQSANTAGLAL